MRLTRLVPVALAAVLVAGCSKQPARAPSPTEAAWVEVTNQGFYDINLYVVRGSNRFKIGMVSGNGSARIEIPRTFVNPGLPIRFLADPIGSNRTPYSQEIPVFPGETIYLRIPPI